MHFQISNSWIIAPVFNILINIIILIIITLMIIILRVRINEIHIIIMHFKRLLFHRFHYEMTMSPRYSTQEEMRWVTMVYFDIQDIHWNKLITPMLFIRMAFCKICTRN